jgi:hypothetical protein
MTKQKFTELSKNLRLFKEQNGSSILHVTPSNYVYECRSSSPGPVHVSLLALRACKTSEHAHRATLIASPPCRKLCVLKSNGARRHRIYFKACRGNNKDMFVQCPCWSMHNCSLLQPDHQSDKVRRLLKTWQVLSFTRSSYFLQCPESSVKPRRQVS